MFDCLCRATCSFVFTSIFGISHAVHFILEFVYRVIGNVLVLGLLVVVKIHQRFRSTVVRERGKT